MTSLYQMPQKHPFDPRVSKFQQGNIPAVRQAMDWSWVKKKVRNIERGSHSTPAWPTLSRNAGRGVCRDLDQESIQGYVLSRGGKVSPRVTGPACRFRIFRGSKRGYGLFAE